MTDKNYCRVLSTLCLIVALYFSTNISRAGTNEGVGKSLLEATACSSSAPPSWCRGSDLGAWVNAAVASLPTISVNGNKYPYGTIHIAPSSGMQTFSTEIGAALPLTFVRIECEQGTFLQYTGTGDWIYAVDPHGTNSWGEVPGGVNGCSFFAAKGHAGGSHAIHFGNTSGYQVTRDYFTGFTAPGDSAVFVENTNYFTEQMDFTGSSFTDNTDSLVFSMHCSTSTCTNSFEHSRLHYYCGGAYGVVSSCLKCINGARCQYEDLSLRFNINGVSGSSVIYVDDKSKFHQNTGTINGESDVPGKGKSFLLYVEPGGYAELNNLHAFCGSCTGTPTGSGINIPVPVIFTDNLPENSFLITYTPTEATQYYSLSCRNLSRTNCSSAPSISAVDGSKIIGTVSCSNQAPKMNVTPLNGGAYPGDQVAVVLTNPGSDCSTASFAVLLEMVGN
jgi:hypothetical protein